MVAFRGLYTLCLATSVEFFSHLSRSHFRYSRDIQPFRALSISSIGDLPVSIFDHKNTHHAIANLPKNHGQTCFHSLSFAQVKNRLPSLNKP
jgi:hypothetical protein